MYNMSLSYLWKLELKPKLASLGNFHNFFRKIWSDIFNTVAEVLLTSTVDWKNNLSLQEEEDEEYEKKWHWSQESDTA